MSVVGCKRVCVLREPRATRLRFYLMYHLLPMIENIRTKDFEIHWMFHKEAH
jgi:hypothetical protein